MVHIDVCSSASIAVAVASVTAAHGELYGLINNAGGWLASPRDTIDLNTYGPITVTEAFLPMVLQSNSGRLH